MINCICSYFNFNKDIIKKINYIKFRKLLKHPITTIEVALTKEDFFIEDSIKIIANNQNILWQKERCLNIAIENLKKNVDKIVWLDTDITFYDDNWLENLEKKLDDYHYVQPFELVLDGDNNLVSYGKACENKEETSETAQGLCWGIRREIIPNGLFDKHPLGLNHILQNMAIKGDYFNDFIKQLDKNTLKFFTEYCESIPNSKIFNIGYCKGLIEHFSHKKIGSISNIQALLKYREINLSLEQNNLYSIKNKTIKKQFIKKEKSIYLKPINGLGNRLRAINSLLSFAKKTNKNLKIYWAESEGFSNAKFEELFEIYNLDDDIEFIEKEEYLEACANYFCLHENFEQSEVTLEYFIKDPMYTYKIINENNFCYEGSSGLSYIFSNVMPIEEDNSFLSSLKPSKEIKEKILSIKNKFDKNTVGVHIRRGDAINSPWRECFLNSDDKMFFERIEEILKKDESTKFFLSTDCEETNTKFVERFKEKIIFQEKAFNKKDLSHKQKKDLQKEAAVDMFLLSNTNYILGTNWSSFSDVSSKIGNKEIEIIKKIKLPLKFHDNEKISVVTALKDREKMLNISINSWINFKEIDEIIVVDWDSKNTIKHIEKIDPRIRIINVKKQNYFNISKAYNLAFKEAKNSRIMKLDVDYILNPYYNIFNELDLKKHNFFTGNWEMSFLDNNLGFIQYINGFVYIHKNNFEAIGGYNEELENYGWEDTDLYNRLYAAGLKRTTVPFNKMYIYHNPHDDSHRVKNYKFKDVKQSITSNKIYCRNSY